MAFPEMLVVAHEFVALLKFGASFEIMEFLATQQVKVSQCMAEEHAERQMIERVLTGMVEREEERALSKIGWMQNVDEGCMGIELPPLNIALVKVHRELATMQYDTKDMVRKNKTVKQAEKYAK